MDLDVEKLIDECVFTTARSSGAGGQKVNKVETKVLLWFDIDNSLVLSDKQKNDLKVKLKGRISGNGILRLSGEKERTQWMNKKEVKEKFTRLVERALAPIKRRKPGKPTAASIKERLERKKRLSEKKRRRRNLSD